MTPTLNTVITWRNCPPAILQFATGRITEISKCGQLIKFGFIYHWVRVADCEVCTDEAAIAFCQRYETVATRRAV